MKLNAKTNIYYFIICLPILILSGTLCFFIITAQVMDGNDELLLQRKKKIVSYLLNDENNTVKFLNNSGEAIIFQTQQSLITETFSDTLIFEKDEDEFWNHRMLVSIDTVNGHYYNIRLWRGTLEYEELVTGISTSMILILVLLFFGFLLIQNWLAKTLWNPFNNTLHALQSFRSNNKQKPKLLETSVEEFKNLNQSVEALMDKAILDFKNQKQFNENAAHEMQTPLAIIKAKLDILIQSEVLGKLEHELIYSINNACYKLSQLNRSLLLLTKIENLQFENKEIIKVEKILEETLLFFDDYLLNEHLVIEKYYTSGILVQMNPHLCFILMKNLVENAIRHNTSDGIIRISLTEKHLTISNSGNTTLDSSSVFERFQKKSSSQDSIGLGLAIAKQIAQTNEMQLIYEFKSGFHNFVLQF